MKKIIFVNKKAQKYTHDFLMIKPTRCTSFSNLFLE